MSAAATTLLAALVIAYLAAEFMLQPARWTRERSTHGWRSRYFYLHLSTHAALALLVLGLVWGAGSVSMSAARIAAATVLVLAGQALVSVAALGRSPERLRWLVLVQSARLLVVLVVWRWLADTALPWRELAAWLVRPERLLVLGAYLLVMQPAAAVVARVMRRWSQAIDTSGSLADAGARIGVLERLLVLTFVLADQLTAIGFLLAAKSVLRFGDLREDRDRRLTEYVLLGTLLSVTVTLAVGLAVSYLLTVL